MLESVSHLFSSTTCAATHVDGEGGESDLAPTDPDECPEACDVWGETSDLVRTDQNLCAENHVDRTLEAMKCAKTSGQVCTDVCSETCDDVCVWGGTSDLAWTDREMCVRTHVDWEGGIVTWFQEIQMQNPVRLAPTVLDILTLISNLPNMPLSPLLLNSLATVLARYFSISPLTSLTILLVRLMLVICTSAPNLSR
jgi:hypothetical protein